MLARNLRLTSLQVVLALAPGQAGCVVAGHVGLGLVLELWLRLVLENRLRLTPEHRLRLIPEHRLGFCTGLDIRIKLDLGFYPVFYPDIEGILG